MFAMNSSWVVHEVLWAWGEKCISYLHYFSSEMYGTRFMKNYALLIAH
jgi:hypothetical protein